MAFWDTQFVLSLPNEASAFRHRGVDQLSVLLLLFYVFICILNVVANMVLKLMYCISGKRNGSLEIV